MEELDKVSIDPNKLEYKVLVGSRLPEEIQKQLVNLLKERRNSFDWSHSNMSVIEPKLIVHNL